VGIEHEDAATVTSTGLGQAAPRDDVHALFDLAPEAILLARGSTWRLVDANRASRELLLFDVDAPIPSDLALADLFADGHSGLQELLERLDGRDLVLNHETHLRDRFGLTFPATVSARLVAGGSEPCLLASVHDVTELKRTEARTRFFWAMAESSIDAIVAWSDGEAIVYANPSSHELFGCNLGELLGRPVRALVGDTAAAEALVQQTASRGEWQGELRLRRTDGTDFDAYVSTWKQADSAGGLPVTVCFLRDITTSKRAEQALRESEERFRVLAELLPGTVFETDRAGTLTFANRRAFQAFGYRHDALSAGLNASQMVAPHERERIGADLQKVLRGEDVRGVEYLAQRKDGSTFPVIIYASPVGRGDVFVGVRCIAVDISERKEAEVALRRSEQRHRILIETVPDIVAGVDADMNYVWLNEPGLAFFGRDAIGRNATEFMVDEAARSEMAKAIRPLFDGSAESIQTESLQRRCDGAERLLAWTYKPLPDASGHITAALSTARDITEMMRMHAELERYNHDLETLVAERTHEVHLLSRIITSTVTAWVISDPAGHLVRWNQAFESLVGQRLEDLVGMRWVDLIPREEHATEEALVKASLAGEGHQVIEQNLCRRDGPVLPVEVRFDALDVGEAEPVVFRIVTDISSRKEAEQRLIAARREAEESSRLKSEFLASISHELRTPLNGILGLANTLVRLREQAHDARTEPQTDSFLARIIKSSRHLQKLINDVLDISRIEAGQLSLAVDQLDPAGVLQATQDHFVAAFEENDLTFTFGVAEATPPVLADKTRLTQILVNLVGNAVKFTDPGGRIEATAAPAEDGALVEFCVSDTGRGIPADKLEKVFERFEQLDRSGSRLGAGLGLAICRQLARAQSGRIWAESELGVGSCFHLTLPAYRGTIIDKPASERAAETL
jgi:two-component system sensor histidine kinase/response regulator